MKKITTLLAILLSCIIFGISLHTYNQNHLSMRASIMNEAKGFFLIITDDPNVNDEHYYKEVAKIITSNNGKVVVLEYKNNTRIAFYAGKMDYEKFGYFSLFDKIEEVNYGDYYTSESKEKELHLYTLFGQIPIEVYHLSDYEKQTGHFNVMLSVIIDIDRFEEIFYQLKLIDPRVEITSLRFDEGGVTATEYPVKLDQQYVILIFITILIIVSLLVFELITNVKKTHVMKIDGFSITTIYYNIFGGFFIRFMFVYLLTSTFLYAIITQFHIRFTIPLIVLLIQYALITLVILMAFGVLLFISTLMISSNLAVKGKGLGVFPKLLISVVSIISLTTFMLMTSANIPIIEHIQI